MAEHYSFHSDRAGISLIDFLSEETSLSKSKLKKVIAIGGLWVKHKDSELVRVYQFNQNLTLDDEVHLFYDEQLLTIPKATLSLICDEGRYALYYKSDSFAIDESPHCDHLHISRAIERDLPEDREIYSIISDEPYVAGFTLFAFHPTTADRFESMLFDQSIKGEFSLNLSSDEKSNVEGLIEELLMHNGDCVQQRFSLNLDQIPLIIEKFLATGIQPSQPFLVCQKLVFPSPFSGQLLTFNQ